MKQNWKTIKAGDVMTGSQGAAYSTINGNVELMMYIKNLEATVKKNKKELPVLGMTGKKHKAGGWVGTGKMTIYYTTSLFRKLMLDYIKNGVDIYFYILIENEDPTSEIGKQSILLKGVNLEEVMIAKLNIEEEYLEEDAAFTFNDVDMLDEFGRLEGE